MGKIALILAGIAVAAAFWVWSQKSKPSPVVVGEYIRVKTVVDQDGSKLKFMVEPVGMPAFVLSAFSLEATMSKSGGTAIKSQEMISVGWSFPFARVEGQTLKLSGVYMAPAAYEFNGEQELVEVQFDNNGANGVQVSLDEKNTVFLRKDTVPVQYRYE